MKVAVLCQLFLTSIAFAIDPLSLRTRGVVTDELGKPIAGAVVDLVHQTVAHQTLTQVALDVIASTKSGGDGLFQFSAVIPCGEDDLCFIRAVASGRCCGFVEIIPRMGA